MHSTPMPVHFASADQVAANQAIWISRQCEIARLKLRTAKAESAVLIID
ncbi:MAG: hypothetical protein WCH05_08125 [Chlorobiaceae bacterium]